MLVQLCTYKYNCRLPLGYLFSRNTLETHLNVLKCTEFPSQSHILGISNEETYSAFSVYWMQEFALCTALWSSDCTSILNGTTELSSFASAYFVVKWIASNAGKHSLLSRSVRWSHEVGNSPGSGKTVSNLHNRVSPLGVQLWYIPGSYHITVLH